MKPSRLLLSAALLAASPLFAADFREGNIEYPSTAKVDVVEDYHGTRVSDPYRWLEDDARTSDEVADWVRRQNELTFGYLKSIPQRGAIRERLEKLWNYERYTSPFKAGDYYYVFHNDGLQNQSVIYRSKSLDDRGDVVLDPNQWSAEGTHALSGMAFSDSGRYMAFAKSVAGSDWQEWFVMDMESGEQLDDHLQWTKFTGATWTKDDKGFFYGRFDAPTEGEEFQALNTGQKLYYHRVGTSQDEDVLVYQRPDEPSWGFAPSVSEDGRYLVISIWKGTDARNMVLYKDLTEPYGMPIELIGTFENDYSFIGNDGTTFYFRTDLEAPRKRVIAIDLRRPQREHWNEILPQDENVLTSANIVSNMIVARYMKDAVTQVRLHKKDGSLVRNVEFPGYGSAGGFGGRSSDTETFYTYSSFNTPPSIYRYDMITGKSELWKRAAVDFDPDDYVVKQVFYPSKDGTKVPMFIAHKKGLKLDGNNPTLLYGYGGFNVSLTPSFSVTRLAWMEMGGVFAMANLRGGGEYGEAWHAAGTKLQKQNVFDDFIAAAEYLIATKYTKSDKLAIQGGSNGGLLVGACMAQRPELFGACLPAVGVMDMLRFHKFTIGWAWVDDYGSSDDPDEFEALLAYSPYHNMQPGTEYPPTMITTADTDDRVVPGHSFKFAAALQYAHRGDNPVLIRIETRAGHGAGKPTSKIIEEVADQWAFLADNLGMNLN
ncbi:MAG: prolyl oligopeptidase family serine peptidase [Planctomycetota bacterium]